MKPAPACARSLCKCLCADECPGGDPLDPASRMVTRVACGHGGLTGAGDCGNVAVEVADRARRRCLMSSARRRLAMLAGPGASGFLTRASTLARAAGVAHRRATGNALAGQEHDAHSMIPRANDAPAKGGLQGRSGLAVASPGLTLMLTGTSRTARTHTLVGLTQGISVGKISRLALNREWFVQRGGRACPGPVCGQCVRSPCRGWTCGGILRRGAG